jgi:hypothetical protein
LLEKGVDVNPHPSTEDEMLTFSRGEIVVSMRLPEECKKKLINYLARQFDIPIHLFYN